MTSRKPRTLRVGPLVYLWRVHHRHERTSAGDIQRCAEVFSAYREGFPSSRLRIVFPESDQHGPGFPRQKGVVADYRPPTFCLNLNRPKVARLLIELAVITGWAPTEHRREHLVPNGYDFLREHRAEVDRVLSSEPPEKPQTA
jgi:hypothetical protein